MELLGDIRYWIGVLVLATWVPAIFTWVVIHPLVNLWRRTGKRVMWTVVAVVGLSLVYAFFHFRDALLGRDLGTSLWLIALSVPFIVLGFYLDHERKKTLTTRILVGTPELEDDASNLLTGGPYARVRHPRYLALVIAYIGYALFANHVGVYIYLAVSAPLLWLIIALEEKELKARFGKPYEDYARKTPRLIPKFF